MTANNRYPGGSRLAHHRERVNADQELSAIGAWFTTTFAWTFENDRHALPIEKGKIAEIISIPKLDVRTMFGIFALICSTHSLT